MTHRDSRSLNLICAYLAFVAVAVAVDQGESQTMEKNDVRKQHTINYYKKRII